ncbi:polyketide cyclase [Mycobacterium sp. PS03-16]|uniref:SRPBCC family protein n=1 Tax=Mycobacterium sp. PS03-16 TaxID=2559611 RepID=UPI0010748614|nr:SRPBCC family protein [Mycobacterium sp. PS03-16]TFV57789.1 polyketide cyclase [Mycobacterium sp. PS03-16]
MTNDVMTATMTVDAPAAAVFAVLADPATHQAIDGTGWVRESLDGARLERSGQTFRMAMYHSNPAYPEKDYEVENKVVALDPPRTIAWQPGQRTAEGELELGGWTWRYDLVADGPSQTVVTLTYDWSAVPPFLREQIAFPPFGREHLENSLAHLADLAERASA